jgi:hypothetical protein
MAPAMSGLRIRRCRTRSGFSGGGGGDDARGYRTGGDGACCRVMLLLQLRHTVAVQVAIETKS